MKPALVALLLTSCGVAPVTDDQCANCHVALAARFATSRHASASQGRVFLAMRSKVSAPQQAFCDGCHAPGHDVTCLDCHGAIGNEAAQNGLLRRSTRVGAAKSVSNAPHTIDVRPFLSSSELCGTCHEVQGPGLFVETPFSEWVDAGTTRTCANCHLDEHRFDVAPLLSGAVEVSVHRLDAMQVEVEAHSLVEGHDFPSGARFAHEAWVEVRVGDTLQRLELTDEFDAVNPLDATRVKVNALRPGEVRRWKVSVPAGRVEARLLYRKYRPALLTWLQVTDLDVPVIEVARATD